MDGYGIVAAFLFMLIGAVDVTLAKYIVRRFGRYRYTVAIIGIGILPMVAYSIAVGSGSISSGAFWLSLAAGAITGVAYIIYYKGLESEQITNVAALTEVQPAILFLFGVLILGESITAIGIAGVIAIFLGATLVMMKDDMKLNRLLLPIIIANALWAAYWIVMNYAISTYGGYSLPLLIARGVAFAMVAAYSVLFGKIEKGNVKAKAPLLALVLAMFIIVSGLLDGATNILFGVVIQSSIVAIGSAIYAIMPIVAAMLGRVVYRDGLGMAQKLGLVIAVAGAIAIVIG